MKLALSGYAGVGKSSLLTIIQNEYKDVIIFPESAREVNLTKDFFSINDVHNDFFQKSIMDNEIMKLNIAHLNNMKNTVFDRTIIDNFVFAELFYGKDRINYQAFKDFVEKFKEAYKIDYIYDRVVLIGATKDEDYVKKVILKDEFRKSTTSDNARNFITQSIIWHERYMEIYDRLKISKEIDYISHFTENQNFNQEMRYILDFSFN
jgi:deoxyadenosine/deoxycytidine kinase